MAVNKIDIDEIISVIHSNVKDPEIKKNLIEDIKKIQAEKEAEKEEEKADNPKTKNKHVFFVRTDETGKAAPAGFLMKVPSESPTADILSKIQTAAAQQNDSKNKSGRGRKSKGGRIEKYYDFFFGSKRKYSKPLGINPLRELVEVIVLPSEEIDFSK
jgi:hypothetical protein